MRRFEILKNKVIINDKKEVLVAYPKTRLPEYPTPYSYAVDLFCADNIIIPPMPCVDVEYTTIVMPQIGFPYGECNSYEDTCIVSASTLVHTGIKASMEPGEIFCIFSNSEMSRLGLVLDSSRRLYDFSYYMKDEENAGEIVFPFYNFSGAPIEIEAGTRIGMGVFQRVLRPENAVYAE